MDETRLSVELAPRHKKGLLLANPMLTASGTFGYGTEYSSLVNIEKLGAIVTKGTTLKPRRGNPQPRIVETPGGILNSIGLENIGVKALIKEKAPIWVHWRVPVIVNIAGETVAEFAKVAEALEGTPGISALEVNVGCPNSKAGGLEFGCDPKAAAQVTRAVKRASSLPILVKLTPNVTDISVVARAVEDEGADALTVANTFLGMDIDVQRRKALPGWGRGGLSGPSIRPLALYAVNSVARVVSIPVIGCGGIRDATDAIKFAMAGASAFQVGSILFRDPLRPIKILQGIKEFLEKEGLRNLTELVGAALERQKPWEFQLAPFVATEENP